MKSASILYFHHCLTKYLLDAGNNFVNDIHTLYLLKELSNLLILDLAGNEVSQRESYRLFTIYNLSKLKILDGAQVTHKETVSAREAYQGKLTIELLGEKIGHFQFSNILFISICLVSLLISFISVYSWQSWI